jgi:nitroimidazol reductase NimA-like FMN-containing flavoprotein (pyridoxamine 5'-phosphate oxidase superfamily)
VLTILVEEYKLKPRQKEFLRAHEVGRLAVASKDGMPHVTPIIYAMDDESPVIATDYGSRKLKILRENNKASLVVDTFEPNKVVMIQGSCEIFERGADFLRLLKVLTDRLEYYRENPWGEGESPILRLSPENIVSWGT